MGKQKYWSPVDPKYFEGKTIRHLQESLVNGEKFVSDHPKFEHGWYNEYLQELKRRIAEKIGK